MHKLGDCLRCERKRDGALNSKRQYSEMWLMQFPNRLNLLDIFTHSLTHKNDEYSRRKKGTVVIFISLQCINNTVSHVFMVWRIIYSFGNSIDKVLFGLKYVHISDAKEQQRLWHFLSSVKRTDHLMRTRIVRHPNALHRAHSSRSMCYCCCCCCRWDWVCDVMCMSCMSRFMRILQ